MGFETTSHSTSKKPVPFSKCLKQKDRNDCPKQYEEGNGSEAGAVWVLHFFKAGYVCCCLLRPFFHNIACVVFKERSVIVKKI
jgi:hypothetical protein